jgi:hypothetical protein
MSQSAPVLCCFFPFVMVIGNLSGRREFVSHSSVSGRGYYTSAFSTPIEVFNTYQQPAQTVENLRNNLKRNDKSEKLRGILHHIRRVIHSFVERPGLGPLSGRSVAALLLLLYLLLGPVRKSTDIISASLTYALLIVIGIATAMVVMHGVALKRYLSASIGTPEQPGVSGELVRVFIALRGARILPLFVLDMRLVFERSGASSALVRVSGFAEGDRRAHVDLSFPHRGEWDIRGIECTLRDVTGLTRFSWTIPQQTAVTIAPVPTYDSNLPVLSSTQRPGEMTIDLFNRQGEPFDIKSYHPSDGVKKIVWKAFAKRGELLSRHPEASMTPEGFVVIFTIAAKEGDMACAQVVAYAESLARLNLEIIASCEGANGRSAACSPEALRELLIDSVWDATPESAGHLQQDAAGLLDYCSQLTPSLKVNKLLLFISAERLAVPGQAKQIEDLAAWLSVQGINPVFCLSRPSGVITMRASTKLDKLSRLLVTPTQDPSSETAIRSYQTFLASCLQRQWEVHV